MSSSCVSIRESGQADATSLGKISSQTMNSAAIDIELTGVKFVAVFLRLVSTEEKLPLERAVLCANIADPVFLGVHSFFMPLSVTNGLKQAITAQGARISSNSRRSGCSCIAAFPFPGAYIQLDAFEYR